MADSSASWNAVSGSAHATSHLPRTRYGTKPRRAGTACSAPLAGAAPPRRAGVPTASEASERYDSDVWKPGCDEMEMERPSRVSDVGANLGGACPTPEQQSDGYDAM